MQIPALLAAPAIGYPVMLGALALNGGAVDANGVEHFALDVQGWDSPELRTDVDDRPLAHGAYRAQSFYGVRNIDVSGLLLAPSNAAMQAALDRLVYETDLTSQDAVLTINDGTPKRALVRRSGRLLTVPISEYALRFELSLTAVDPRKYGITERSVTVSAAGGGTVNNEGNFRSGAPVVIEFRGASTSPVVSIGGSSIGLSGVPAGRTVTVDTLEGTVLYENGATAYSLVTAGSVFPVIAPLTSAAVTYAGSGSAVVRYRPAWL